MGRNVWSTLAGRTAMPLFLCLIGPTPIMAQSKDPPQPEPTRPAAAGQLDRVRALYGRALAYDEPGRRRVGLIQTMSLINELAARHESDTALILQLLSVRNRVLTALGDTQAVERSVKEQARTAREKLSTEDHGRWLAGEVDDLRRLGELDLALGLLAESIASDPLSELGARRSLLVGDLLVQRHLPEGGFDQAIRHYRDVAQKFNESRPDLAADARLRLARTLWRNGQTDEAKQVFKELEQSANPSIAETAEHYTELPEVRSFEAASRTEGKK